MTNILSTKEIIQCGTLVIPKEIKKNAVSIYIVSSVEIFIRNENITSEECKTKNVWNNFGRRVVYKPSKLQG